MFCRNCGQSLPDNTIFCTNCGTKTVSLNRADSKAEAITVPPVSSQQPAAFRPGAVSPSDVPHPNAALNPVIKKNKKSMSRFGSPLPSFWSFFSAQAT